MNSMTEEATKAKENYITYTLIYTYIYIYFTIYNIVDDALVTFNYCRTITQWSSGVRFHITNPNYLLTTIHFTCFYFDKSAYILRECFLEYIVLYIYS